jgi:hypothetical protein
MLIGNATTSRAATHAARRWWRRISWPLTAILTLQATLSVSLMRGTTAFTDEALYLWAGRLELDHWFQRSPLPHGTGLTQPFTGYFSGAPVIYPPLGALADRIGGLDGARVLSLTFMLTCTVLLYLAGQRLHGRTAALCACALWAASEPALRLAFATFDPLSDLLLAAAVWVIVRTAPRMRRAELIVVAAALAVLGTVTAYAAIVYLPVIIVLAAAVWAPYAGWAKAAEMAAWLGAAVTGLLVFTLTGLHLWAGLMHTTIARSHTYDHSPVSVIAHNAFIYAGLIPFLAAATAVAAVASRGRQRVLLCVLAAASLVVPLGQLRSATATSIDKHLALGLWLAALAAGYGCAQAACCCTLFALPAITGYEAASAVYHYWPDSAPFTSALRRAVSGTTGPVLVSQGGEAADAVAAYALPSLAWQRYADEYATTLNPTGPPSGWARFYRGQLSAHRDSVVAVFYRTDLSSPSLPGQMLFMRPSSPQAAVGGLLKVVASESHLPGLLSFTRVMEADRDYRLVAVGPYDGSVADWTFAIWKRFSPQRITPARRPTGPAGRTRRHPHHGRSPDDSHPATR